MSFSESLTVRILGDSSGLRQELDTVSSEIQKLQQNLSSTVGSTGQLRQSFTKLSSGLKPLQQINAQLLQVQQHVRAISQQPVTLNVQPAIQSLQQLIQYAIMVARQIQMITGRTGGGRTSPIAPAGPIGGGGNGGGPVRNFASGGLVSGPSGIDRVPTRLTAGEFVLSQSAVKTVGVSYLERLNQQPQQVLNQKPFANQPNPLLTAPIQRISKTLNAPFEQSRSLADSLQKQQPQRTPPQVANNTSNHFGGININVEQSADLDTLFRDFRAQRITQRHRRG